MLTASQEALLTYIGSVATKPQVRSALFPFSGERLSSAVWASMKDDWPAVVAHLGVNGLRLLSPAAQTIARRATGGKAPGIEKIVGGLFEMAGDAIADHMKKRR